VTFALELIGQEAIQQALATEPGRWDRAHSRCSAGRCDSSASSAKLSQEALAETAHLNRSYLSEIEGGLVALSLLIVLRLARARDIL